MDPTIDARGKVLLHASVRAQETAEGGIELSEQRFEVCEYWRREFAEARAGRIENADIPKAGRDGPDDFKLRRIGDQSHASV